MSSFLTNLVLMMSSLMIATQSGKSNKNVNPYVVGNCKGGCSWGKAAQICHKYFGFYSRLAIIVDDEDAVNAMKAISDANYADPFGYNYWFGMRDRKGTDQWRASDGRYSQRCVFIEQSQNSDRSVKCKNLDIWQRKQPSDSNGDKRCGLIVAGGNVDEIRMFAQSESCDAKISNGDINKVLCKNPDAYDKYAELEWVEDPDEDYEADMELAELINVSLNEYNNLFTAYSLQTICIIFVGILAMLMTISCLVYKKWCKVNHDEYQALIK